MQLFACMFARQCGTYPSSLHATCQQLLCLCWPVGKQSVKVHSVTQTHSPLLLTPFSLRAVLKSNFSPSAHLLPRAWPIDLTVYTQVFNWCFLGWEGFFMGSQNNTQMKIYLVLPQITKYSVIIWMTITQLIQLKLKSWIIHQSSNITLI